MTATTTPAISRIRFNSRHEFAAFATQSNAPRYSVICSTFYREHHKTLGIAPGEALFSDDPTALNKAALAWDRNQVKVSIVPNNIEPGDRALWGAFAGPDRIWLVTAAPDFPDDLLDPVFVMDGPLLSAPQEKAEEMALEQLCDQDEHPLVFIDNQDRIDRQFLFEILADDAEKSPWGFSG